MENSASFVPSPIANSKTPGPTTCASKATARSIRTIHKRPDSTEKNKSNPTAPSGGPMGTLFATNSPNSRIGRSRNFGATIFYRRSATCSEKPAANVACPIANSFSTSVIIRNSKSMSPRAFPSNRTGLFLTRTIAIRTKTWTCTKGTSTSPTRPLCRFMPRHRIGLPIFPGRRPKIGRPPAVSCLRIPLCTPRIEMGRLS
mmetsp:Transcript_9303/g.25727  ORF Transcript_9303/g.25727 Transcript_9303/m.25727 type:complete len:201 (-) Transcript_9303:1036-1638(-)